MPGPEMDLKRELFEAGSRLQKPLASVDDLLALLDRVEHCLSFVEQQPPVEMQDALCPAFKALTIKELMNHTDTDVRVGVTTCLTEISRITAPDVPYGDEIMKEVFRLTISAFEGLSDTSSKSFGKRVSILETVARVRSCAVLLDLDCDELVVVMFHNFYKCIRDIHTANVFTSMESIMTLIIEEYDEISTELLFALLSVLKRENQDALPIAKKLGEKVVQNCAHKVKSSIVGAIKSLKINLLDYDFVVTLACHAAPGHDPFGETTPDVTLVSGDESPQKPVEKETTCEASPSLSPHIPPIDCIIPVEEDDASLEMLNASHEPDSNVLGCATETIQDQVPVGVVTVSQDMTVFVPQSETKSENRERKLINTEDITHTESNKVPQLETNINIRVLEIHQNDIPVDQNVPEKNSDFSNQLSQKAVENNVNLGPPSPTDNPPEICSSKMIGRPEEQISVHEASSSQNSERRPSNELNDSEIVHVSLEKVTPDGVGEASNIGPSVEIKNEQDDEGFTQLGVTDATVRSKKRGRPRKDASTDAATGVIEGISPAGTSRKRSRSTFVYPNQGEQYGENLVGTRIKVWWPQDTEFYEGVVEAYNPITRKHTVLYTDNEREILKLHTQKWKLVKSHVGSEKNQVTSNTTAGIASEKQENQKLKTESSSAGITGNTDSPLKRRRGRPAKNYAAFANDDSPNKVSVSDGQSQLNEKPNGPLADDGNSIEPMDSMPRCTDAPRMTPENNEHNILPENGNAQTNQDTTMVTVRDTTAPKPAVKFDMNDPFSYRSDDGSVDSETATPEVGNSNVSVVEEVKSGSASVPKTSGTNTKYSAFPTQISSRRKRGTSLNASSPIVTASVDTLTKKRRGRPPYKFLFQNSIEESKSLSQQLGDPKVDKARTFDNSDKVALVQSKGSLDESENVQCMSAENNLAKSTPDSVIIATKEVSPAQNSSQLILGERKFGSPTILKIKFKTTNAEPIIRKRRRSKKTTSSHSEQWNKDGSLKRPRGRPPFRLKPDSKAEEAFDSSSVTKLNSQIINKAEITIANTSGHLFKNDTNLPTAPVLANVSIKDNKDTPDSTSNVDGVSAAIGSNSVVVTEARISN